MIPFYFFWWTFFDTYMIQIVVAVKNSKSYDYYVYRIKLNYVQDTYVVFQFFKKCNIWYILHIATLGTAIWTSWFCVFGEGERSFVFQRILCDLKKTSSGMFVFSFRRFFPWKCAHTQCYHQNYANTVLADEIWLWYDM